MSVEFPSTPSFNFFPAKIKKVSHFCHLFTILLTLENKEVKTILQTARICQTSVRAYQIIRLHMKMAELTIVHQTEITNAEKEIAALQNAEGLSDIRYFLTAL